uniref:HMG box domain-containing protein n=1 Tax=Meloidogyne javanica TaxID=6303 RepID=A0A915N4U9_MELJA
MSPQNSFLLWSIDYKRNNQLGFFRHLRFAEHSELQKILGAKWRTLPDEEKRIWNEKADRIRAAKSAIHRIPIL